MLSVVLLALPLSCADAGARWRVEPPAVEVGEPFRLVLELEHGADESPAALAPGELALSDSWLVLGREESHGEARGDGRTSTLAWRVVSLEPGERSLAEDLSAFAFGAGVVRIQVGDAQVRVTSVLAEGEDAPRPLTGFEGELGPAPEAGGFPWALLAGALVVLAAPLTFLWLRRRARGVPAAEPTLAERLAALQARAGTGEGREGCYALTRLLREHTDRFRKKDRAALTDEEWLAEVAASLEVPKGAVEELGGVFERAARVKYGGEEPSPWALEETFARARRALAGVGPEVRA